jgi:hypothetical protein
MNPGTFNLSMYRGDSYAWRFILWEDGAKTIPVDLTNVDVKVEVRDKPGGTVILPMPCVVTPPNIIDMSMTPEMYATCPTRGVWDMQLTFDDGRVSTIIGGSTSITPDVTDSVILASTRRV